MLSIMLIVMGIYIIVWICSKNRKKICGAGTVLGWILVIFCMVAYIGSFTYFNNSMSDLWKTAGWRMLRLWCTRDVVREGLIALMQLGIFLFIYSCFCYALSESVGVSEKTVKWYCLSAVPFFVQTVLFSADLFTAILNSSDLSDDWSRNLYIFLTRYGENIFRFIDAAYLAGTLALLIWQYMKMPRIPVIRQKSLCVRLAILALSGSYLIMCYWMPMVLIRPTVITDYFLYNIPKVGERLGYLELAITAVVGVGIFLVFMIWYYSSIIRRDQGIQVALRKSSDMASTTMRIISHSVKNDLLAISSEAEYLQEICLGNEEALYSLKLITESCSNAMNNISVSYDYLKRPNIVLKRMELGEAVRKNLDHYGSMGIPVEVDIPKNAIEVYLDENAFDEVLRNLLENAAEAVRQKKEDGGNIKVKVDVKEKWALISVADNGIGMSKEQMEHIFEPFYSTKSAKKNWGIGLFYCYWVIDAHNGNISVKSRQGEGTTFSIVLPCLGIN